MGKDVESNANVFEQLGFSGDEVTNLTIRHNLINELKTFIQENKLSTRKAGELFGISNSRVSDLINSHVDKFTIDYLVNLMVKAGKRVRIEIDTDY